MRNHARLLRVPLPAIAPAPPRLAAPRTELLLMDGGLPATSAPCEARSAHGYLGIENDVIARITTWMRR